MLQKSLEAGTGVCCHRISPVRLSMLTLVTWTASAMPCAPHHELIGYPTPSLPWWNDIMYQKKLSSLKLSLSDMVATAMQKSLRQPYYQNTNSNFLSALNTPSSENRSFQNGQPLIRHSLCGFCCCFAFVFLFFPFGFGWQGSQRHSALRHWWS